MTAREMVTALRQERALLDEAIGKLERYAAAQRSLPEVTQPGRRGRKSMGREERLIVAARMRAFWAKRRATVS